MDGGRVDDAGEVAGLDHQGHHRGRWQRFGRREQNLQCGIVIVRNYSCPDITCSVVDDIVQLDADRGGVDALLLALFAFVGVNFAGEAGEGWRVLETEADGRSGGHFRHDCMGFGPVVVCESGALPIVPDESV